MRTDGRSVGEQWRDYQIFSDVKITSWWSAGALARELR